MRILYITAGAGRMYCGGCLRDGALAAALTRMGHDVLCVPLYTPLRIEAESVAIDRLFYGGINVFLQQKIPLFRHTPRFVDRLFDSKALLGFASRFAHLTTAHDLARLAISVLEGEEGGQRKEFRRLIAWLRTQPRPDVVVLPNTMLSVLAEGLRTALGAPVVALLSGEDAFIEEFPEPYRSQAIAVLRRRAAACDGFMASNRSYAAFMAEYLAAPLDKIRVTPLGIDCRDYEGVARNEPPLFTIGYLARVCPQKGLRQLAEALRVLKANPATSSCRVRAAGYLAGEYRAYLREILSDVEKWGIADSFEYIGELERAGKIRFLSSLSALCVPAPHPESKGQYVPEALAAGTPVVLPRVGCFPEWIEATGGGLLCEPGSPEALAAALARLMGDQALARRLGEAGQKAVLERFTVERMALATVEALANFLK